MTSSLFFVINGIIAVFIGFESALMKFAGLLVAISLWFNGTLTDLSSGGMNAFVLDGWQMFRDLANLGFVLGIIIVAFATIFRLKSYSASQILWKLVVAALLVNFSLVIMAPFLSVSQSFSNYFLAKVAGDNGSDVNTMFFTSAKKMVDILHPLEIMQTPTAPPSRSSWWAWTKMAANALFGNEMDALSQGVGDAVSGLVGVFLLAVIFLTLLGFSVVLLIRYFFIAFLMILSPIVWLLWVFPGTAKHFSKWWSEFIKWIVYPPAVLFFVDLALVLYNTGASSQGSVGTFNDRMSSAGAGGDVIGRLPISVIVASLMSVGLLVGGMIVAGKLGVHGGDMATGAAGKAKDWAVGLGKKKAGDWGARAGSRAMQSKVGKNVVGGVGKTLGRIPLVGDTLHQKVIEGQQAVEKRANRQTEDAKGRFAQYSDQQLRAAWRSGDVRDRAAMLDLLASKDKLGLVSDLATHQDYQKAYAALRRGGNGKAVGDISKKLGMSEDMMILASGGNVYEMDKDGKPKIGDDGKPVGVSYDKAAEKFYGSLDAKEWQSLAKTSGGSLLRGEPILGFEKNQADLIGQHYVKNILSDETGKAIAGTAPGLKDGKSLEIFYQKMLEETAEEANQLSKDPTWTELMAEAIEKSGGDREELVDRIQAGMTILPDSVSREDRARLERRLKRLKHSMASALGGFRESRDESKDGKKSGDEREKKSEEKK